MTDFEQIEDGSAMLDLTNVSDGTLLTCMRESGIFGPKELTSNVFYIDNVRNAWRLFTHSTLDANYNSWMDTWNAFEQYARQLSKDFKVDFLNVDGVEHWKRFDESNMLPEETPYDLYFSDHGKIRIYDNGSVTLGMNSLGHCSVIYLHTMEEFMQKLARQKGF
jgi:hypothetical protein